MADLPSPSSAAAGDDAVAARVAAAARVPLDRARFFLEAAGGDEAVALRMVQGAKKIDQATFSFFSRKRSPSSFFDPFSFLSLSRERNPSWPKTFNRNNLNNNNKTEHEGGGSGGGGVRARTSPRRGAAAAAAGGAGAAGATRAPAPLPPARRPQARGNSNANGGLVSGFLASLIRLPFEILGTALTAAAAGLDLLARAASGGALPGPLAGALRGLARAAAALAPAPSSSSSRRGGGRGASRVWRGGTATIGPAHSAGGLDGDIDDDDEFADPLAAAARFAASFRESYGDGGPAWAVAPWASAADAASRAHRLCFVYLHAPRHDATGAQSSDF